MCVIGGIGTVHSAHDAGGTECHDRLSFNRRRKAWSLRDWAGLYRDSPSRQSKLQVADRCVGGGGEEGSTSLSVPEGHILTTQRQYFSPLHCRSVITSCLVSPHQHCHFAFCTAIISCLIPPLPSPLHCRTTITTEDAERRCVSPAGLQAAIDKVVADFPAGSRRVQLLG